MDVVLLIHLEAAADRSPVWWAESDELPGMTASAESLPELRETLAEVFADLEAEDGEPIRVVSERLMGAEPSTPLPAGPILDREGPAPVEAAPAPYQVLLVAA